MQRLKICVGVGKALSYIHYDVGRDFSVIHCNIKSSKILLDDIWEPKLSGFELSLRNTVARRHRLLLTRDIVKNVYLDPKYKKTDGVTHKSDVYSFAVVLFKILCGRSAVLPDEELGEGLQEQGSSGIQMLYITNRISEILKESRESISRSSSSAKELVPLELFDAMKLDVSELSSSTSLPLSLSTKSPSMKPDSFPFAPSCTRFIKTLVCVDGKDEQSTKPDDSTAGEAVTTASVDDSVVPTTIEEITLAQTLIQIKAAKPKVVTTAATTTTTTRPKDRGVVVQEPSEFRVPQETQPSSSKDKGKGIMIEPEVPLKRKDQIALDEQIARDIQAKLDAELLEEQKLARKQEEEANIALIESWENTQAMMEADRLLAERLQSKEREELTDEEKAKLFMELMEKRRKHFAALRAQEKRNRPPTKAQKRTQMSTYLKHMGGYTYKQLKGKSFDEIQKLFDKEMKRVNTFVAMGSEVQESKEKKEEGREETTKGSRKKMLGRKRAGKEQQKESSKKQKVEEEKESEEVDEAELKKLLVIKKDEDIAIDAIPLATKLPVIIDYKLHKEGMLVHYQLIRADGSSKRYSSMIRMLQGIDREDLEALWRIVKAKYGDTRPDNEFERVLWGDLKVMFEPDKRSDVWRILQGYRVTI
ncbi:ribonuclease H-like domain, reverse transcriptase, RNA-dependent DNA polymerase [Tanacetum coccineum]